MHPPAMVRPSKICVEALPVVRRKTTTVEANSFPTSSAARRRPNPLSKFSTPPS
jgi:hypothetical protein